MHTNPRPVGTGRPKTYELNGVSMKRTLRSATVVMLALVTMLSCSPDDTDRTSPLEPEVTHVEATASATSYTRITEHPPALLSLEVSQVISLLGGELRIAGHTLSVPRGAVTVPTLFSMRVIRNGYIEVDNSALLRGLLGRVLDVGERGFNRPVTVELSYARATNVTDPTRLKIMRLNPDGRHEILPSVVDLERKTVSAQLDHFSRYCVISD